LAGVGGPRRGRREPRRRPPRRRPSRLTTRLPPTCVSARWRSRSGSAAEIRGSVSLATTGIAHWQDPKRRTGVDRGI